MDGIIIGLLNLMIICPVFDIETIYAVNGKGSLGIFYFSLTVGATNVKLTSVLF